MTRPAASALTALILVAIAPATARAGEGADSPIPIPIRPGESIEADLPFGDPYATEIVFDLEAMAAGPLTIEARSHRFFPFLDVVRLDAGGVPAARRIFRRGGPGTVPGARGLLEAQEGDRYRIRVQSPEVPWCGGEFVLSVIEGMNEASPLGAEPDYPDLWGPSEWLEATMAHWDEATALAQAGGRPECLARSLLGRALDTVRRPNGMPVPPEELEEEVLPWARQALATTEGGLGPAHPLVGESLRGLATILKRTQSLKEAERHAERALGLLESALGAGHVEVARCLRELEAIRSAWAGENEEPLRSEPAGLERAVSILEDRLGPDHPELGDALFDLGELYHWKLGDYGRARSLLARALRISEATRDPDHPQIGSRSFYMAQLLQHGGAYAESAPHAVRALTIDLERYGPDGHADLIWSHKKVMEALLNVGRYAEAKVQADRIAALAETFRDRRGGYDYAVALQGLSRFQETMGDYEEARALSERVIGLIDGMPHPARAKRHFHAWASSDLADLLVRMGSYGEAKDRFEEALAVREEIWGPDHPLTAVDLDGLGVALWRIGDLEGARSRLERALAIRERSTSPESAARTLHHLSLVLRDMGLPAEAMNRAGRALGIYEDRFGPDHPEVAVVLGTIAELHAAAGHRAEALAAALRADGIGRDLLRLTSRSLHEDLALRVAARRGSSLDLAVGIAAAAGAPPSAARRAWDAVIRSRAVVLDEMARRHRGLAAREGSETDGLIEAFATASARLANLLVRGPGERQDPEIYRSMLREARGERQRAEEALATVSAPFREEVATHDIGLGKVADHLPAGSALVAFAIDRRDPPSYIGFVLASGSGEPSVVRIGGAAEIDALVDRWRRLAGASGGGSEQAERAVRAAGEALRRKLWDPIAARTAGAKRVFVVPDGSIQLVNLAALPAERDRYLVEEEPVLHLLSTERDLVILSRRTEAQGGLFAVGGAAFDDTSQFAALGGGAGKRPVGPAGTSAVSAFRGDRADCAGFSALRFDPLEASGQEVRDIVAIWRQRADREPTAVGLTGGDASEPAFKSGAPGHRVLHLATHGFFLEGRCASALGGSRGVGAAVARPAGAESGPGRLPPPAPGENPLLLSGLALAGANHRGAAGPEEDDGVLTAQEIAAIDLTGVGWAVLSGCDTGLGEIRAGEGVFGLRRAFQIAGAHTSIMSLWSVEDRSTQRWMKALYEMRLIRGMDTAAAVREASLSVLRERRAAGESTHPFFWAGFVAAGDWR